MRHTITGKIRIMPAGHKGTWYRDEKGNFHAEFFKAVVGAAGDDGKYHSYEFSVDAADAEAYANMKVGTTFKVTLVDRTKQVVDENGVEQTVPDTTLSADKATVYHKTILEDIEVAKDGFVARPRTVMYFADVKAKKDNDEDGEL